MPLNRAFWVVTPEQLRVLSLIGMGLALVALGSWLFLRQEFFPRLAGFRLPAWRVRLAPGALRTALAMTVLLGIAFALRCHGVERHGMSHVEVYVPGIELPAEISAPPRRVELARTLQWHYFHEPHAPAFYYLGWVWTRIFGTGLTALRMPSILFGVATVWLTFLVGNRVYGRRVGWIAAILLTLNGHHVEWSQMARMYAMGTFVGMASVLVWVRLLRAQHPRPVEELAYLGLLTLALYTQYLLWTLVAAQMIYTGFQGRSGRLPRLLFYQAAAVVLASPMVGQAVLLARPAEFDPGFFAFLQDFVGFGFLFVPESVGPAPRDAPALLQWSLAIAALLLLVRVARDATRAIDAPRDSTARPQGLDCSRRWC